MPTNGSHPAWCDPTRCEAGRLGGSHSSTPYAVDFDRRGNGMARIRVWLRPPARVQDRPVPLVEVTIGDIDAGQTCGASLTLNQAMQLESLLAAAIGQVGAS